MTKSSKSHPSLHCTRLYAKSRGVGERWRWEGQPKAWLEPGTRTPGLPITCRLKKKTKQQQQKTPLKLHLFLISKMQLFCSEEENTIKGRQTTTQPLAISHKSTLGRNSPKKNSLRFASPGRQPREVKNQEDKDWDDVARACSAHALTDSSQQPAKNPIPHTASGQAFRYPPGSSQMLGDTCHSHPELHRYQQQTTKPPHPVPVWLTAV